MKEIDNLFGKEPGATGNWPSTVADAMARRDVQVDEAVTTLRRTAAATAASVAALMHVVNPDASHSLARQAASKMSDHTGFVTVAEQLHDIASQLRELESSVRSLLARTRKDAAPDD
ncbi:hypothetical protein VAPA_2c07930 [Variovorax paradoxus B4]|uniref:Uncharacterized protein n=1 Tax=Variovorax paradoxus B4 TaxID=1246301 RepID=T1XMJ3_VARPD|nr:hypothetical protein [Variovorax paradoxus]AGU53350.1 hypothetical protein VAPA_2c07930 [Variovorax paradoxus B4]